MILVAGGTGRLGRLVVELLRQRGAQVRVLTRDVERAAPLRPLGVEVARGDVRRAADLTSAMDGVDTVLSAMHGFVGHRGISPASVDRDGNRNLVEAAEHAGASVVMMSVVGAAPDSPLELSRMKAAAEQHLRTVSSSWTIVRAVAFAQLWIELMQQTAARGGRPLVFGQGQQPIQFVSVDDVAQAVAIALLDESLRGSAIEIAGPDRWTFTRLAEAVQDTAGRTGPPRHIPPAMLKVMASLGWVQPQLARQAKAALVMDREPLPSADGAFRLAHPELPSTSITELLAAGEDTAAGTARGSRRRGDQTHP
ncbi:hypothetical protein GCM10027052_07670 [Parafrigoribacterium mesophilum]|uniref:SDR family oxidoreductase n=1 Tax=Parafrigoribacterium mesophilum TaxID=433646 RepID=UPI0031FCFCE5